MKVILSSHIQNHGHVAFYFLFLMIGLVMLLLFLLLCC